MVDVAHLLRADGALKSRLCCAQAWEQSERQTDARFPRAPRFRKSGFLSAAPAPRAPLATHPPRALIHKALTSTKTHQPRRRGRRTSRVAPHFHTDPSSFITQSAKSVTRLKPQLKPLHIRLKLIMSVGPRGICLRTRPGPSQSIGSEGACPVFRLQASTREQRQRLGPVFAKIFLQQLR